MLKWWNDTSQTVLYFLPDCGCWDCAYCARKRSKMWLFAAVNGVKVLQAENRAVDFLTVTSHEKLTADATLAVLNSAWVKLNRRIKRATDDHEYFLIPEQHQNGRWHLHAITTARLPKKWWKDNARSCGFGYQSDVQEVGSVGGVAGYVSKYLTKVLQNSNLPKRFKRVRLSQGWPELPEIERPAGWHGVRLPPETSLQSEVDRLTETGWTVVIADEPGAWEWMNGGGLL